MPNIHTYIRFLLIVSIVVSATNCRAQSFHSAIVKSPAAGTMFIYPERIPLKAGGLFAAERGLMFVPLNRSNPESDIIAVEIYRFPRSENADPETPPMFMLNGGPGFPGLEKALGRRGNFEREIQPYLDISDVIVVGQRGIGSSKPDTNIELPSPDPQPVDQPYNDAKAIAEFREALSQERKFWIDRGVDLTGFNVVEAATDLHDVSQALGYKKITILGGSFGSHWGMALMRQYPEIVARAVLNGMEGPDHTWDHPGWYWNVYKRVAEDAETSEALKELIPEGGLVAAMEAIAAKADEEPFIVTLDEGSDNEKKVLIDGRAIRYLARGYSAGLRAWPADVITMSNGDFEKAARRVYMRSRSRGRQTTTASFWMLDSGSGITAKRRAEFESDPAMKIIGSTFWTYSAGSPVWQIDLGDKFRQNFETSIPTVIVHGTWDRKTPFENALELRPYFTNCKFITVKRGTHGAIGEAKRAMPSFNSALMKFVETGDSSGLPDDIELPQPRWVVPDDEEEPSK